MSRLNGDRARFQKLRKAGVLRRVRARAMHATLKAEATANANTLATPPEIRPPHADGHLRLVARSASAPEV